MGSYTDFGINCIVYLKYIFENYLSAYFLHSLVALLANLKQQYVACVFIHIFIFMGKSFHPVKPFLRPSPSSSKAAA